MKTTTSITYPVFALFALACFGLSPQAQAVCQEGCSGNNTFLGEDALLNNAGFTNTAVGFDALLSNTTGNGNTAIGSSALVSNTSGNANTATGSNALFENTTGGFNTADGIFALLSNSTGGSNTAMGGDALSSNTAGNNNTAIGSDALEIASGSSNIAVGFEAGVKLTTGSNNIYIGSRGTFSESRTIRIGDPSTHGRISIAGISGVTVAAGVGVLVDTNGQLGTVVSSERFKDAIKPMDKASEAILVLKPVTFRYKHDLDPKGIPQFGLVAEDVEKVNPDLVARDDEGKPYSVRYEAVNAMLLNEFLKEHRTVQEQQKEIDSLKAELKEQRTLIQKVSAQLEVSKPAAQTVQNGQ